MLCPALASLCSPFQNKEGGRKVEREGRGVGREREREKEGDREEYYN